MYKSDLLSRRAVEKHISKTLTNSSIKRYFITILWGGFHCLVITLLMREIYLIHCIIKIYYDHGDHYDLLIIEIHLFILGDFIVNWCIAWCMNSLISSTSYQVENRPCGNLDMKSCFSFMFSQFFFGIPSSLVSSVFLIEQVYFGLILDDSIYSFHSKSNTLYTY